MSDKINKGCWMDEREQDRLRYIENKLECNSSHAIRHCVKVVYETMKAREEEELKLEAEYERIGVIHGKKGE